MAGGIQNFSQENEEEGEEKLKLKSIFNFIVFLIQSFLLIS